MAGRSPFTTEFTATHTALTGGGFETDWVTLAASLAKLTAASGPHDAFATSVEDLRTQAKKAGKSNKAGEGDALLAASGGYDVTKPSVGTGMTAAARQRAAALKLLRHLSLLRKKGGQQVWILSLANGFTDWPSVAMASADLSRMKTLMSDQTEPFSKSDKGHLADAAQEAIKWVQKTLILLANASGTDKKATAAKDLVKRWFADAGASATDVDNAVSTLAAGFKKIQAVLNSGRLLLTDHPEVRNATDADNAGFWKSEAFVKGAREGLDVIYIESAFFGKKNTIKGGLKNWARILVHELSHRELATEDLFYSWQGMKPTAGTFPMASALKNADSWAFFCVDAANELSKTERNTALK